MPSTVVKFRALEVGASRDEWDDVPGSAKVGVPQFFPQSLLRDGISISELSHTIHPKSWHGLGCLSQPRG